MAGQTDTMDEFEAGKVVEALRRHGVIASVARPSTFSFGVRVPLPDGREALWDVDGAASLEAQILRDGVLVGFVHQVTGSEDFDVEQTAQAIAGTDYGTVP